MPFFSLCTLFGKSLTKTDRNLSHRIAGWVVCPMMSDGDLTVSVDMTLEQC